ncbi:Uncharacterised protein [Mycobacteroides abscessus subsp. massiliense]|nr:Uncharacterised protein [Mycobacteroides abscessus subsp. massiliense]
MQGVGGPVDERAVAVLHLVDTAQGAAQFVRGGLDAGVLVRGQGQHHTAGPQDAGGLGQHRVEGVQQEGAAIDDLGELARALLAQTQFLLDELELLGVHLGQQPVGVGEQLGQRDGNLGALGDDGAVLEEWSLIRDALEVDVLLTGRRETGDAHLRRDGDLVLRLAVPILTPRSATS